MKIICIGAGIVLATIVLLTSCGGAGPGAGPAQRAEIPIRVSLFPSAVTLDQGATQQFTATVSGAKNPAVAWSVLEGSAGGSINAEGIYTAPDSEGPFHVVATSTTDRTKNATAAVAVNAVRLNVSPASGHFQPAATHQFTATVTGTVNRNVIWSVQEGSVGGVISSAGLYTAPSQLGQYHIVVTSVAHSNIFAEATVAVVDSGFTNVSEMIEARANHTATLLANGDVLLVGGVRDNGNGWGVTATAEIFDYTTGSFRPTGEMKTPRERHAATLLPNGKVLVTGGGYESWDGLEWISLDSAELYDPESGQFAPAGPMTTPRSAHSATLVAGGKVLITGGALGLTAKTAELYDAEALTSTSTGSMTEERYWWTAATLLADGRVLITGGGGRSAEIFDPSTGLFVIAGSFPRDAHTATLLADKRVLLAGGYWFTDAASESVFFDDAEIFSPASSQFGFLAKMNSFRSEHTATLLGNGQVLLVGGWASGSFYSTAELFDPSTSAFLVTADMAEPRIGHTATLLPDGRVLVAGGGRDKSAEMYTPH